MNLPTAQSSGQTLLVISSDRANMQLMTQLLAMRSEFLVLTATNGLDGIQLAMVVQPAAVVMDTGLSDTRAEAVLKILKEHPRTSMIPIIAVSSDAQASQVLAGLKVGFYRYLTKPYKLLNLLEAVDDALGYSLGISVVS